MRHSLAVKFIAICLAALSLLVALGSGAAILALAASDLYENPVEELYNESMHSERQEFAVNLAHRYASLKLGQLPDSYLNDYYGIAWLYNTFQYGKYFYTIRNEHGDIVESTMEDAPAGGTRYEMAVTNIRYRAVVEILSEDAEENTIPATTTPPFTTDSPEPLPTETYGLEVARELETYEDNYFDYEQQKLVYFTFTYQDLPPYTVELYLLPGAMPEEYAWSLLRQVWEVRYELFYVFGVSLLLFAVFAVYLCWTAGRKRGSEEVKAGGLNQTPLDLYFGMVALIYVCCFFLLIEGGEYLLRNSPNIVSYFLVILGFGICLLFVGFCYACAAQLKMPDKYWWHNSLTGQAVKLSIRLCRWAWGVTVKLWNWASVLLVKLWNWFVDGCIWFFHNLPAAARWGVNMVRRNLRWIGRNILVVFRWFGTSIATLYGLLPLMWQWLLAGFTLCLFIFLAIFNRSGSMSLLLLAACVGIVVYGGYCFGVLLKNTKRMGQGDLDTQVEDKLLIGAFQEFAGDLNALADVAVVAAQKQLKSERMKTELITNVSHDIKTPLTSIINYVDLLQKPHTDEEQEMYLEVLSRQSGQLKKLIEDLMEMSKASTGNMNVDITAVDAAEAINQALGEFADKLERIQLTPVFRQPERPIFMKADGRLAWRVLSNLLSNAYKYALPGTRLYIDLQELDGKVLISLKNISREELNVSAEELLERFVRGDASRNTEGSGLGLNIAQSLMELQKGQLQLLVDGDLFKVTLIFPAVKMD